MSKHQAMRAALDALILARRAIEPLTGAQIKLHRLPAETPDKIDAAISLLSAAVKEKLEPAPSEPDEGAQWTIDRAADFLEYYADYIRREVKCADIEAHPYLPELEYVAGQVRDWFGRCEAGERCSCPPGSESRAKCCYWKSGPGNAPQKGSA